MKVKNTMLEKEKINLESNKYYFCCCAGVGDTMIIAAFMDVLQKKYCADIVLLIRESHAFLMHMFAIRNYIITDFSDDDYYLSRKKSSLPKKGFLYMAHPCAHRELKSFFEPIQKHYSTKAFLPWFRDFLNLKNEEKLSNPVCKPVLSEKLETQLEQLAPLDKIVLFSNEATSVIPICEEFWEELAKEISHNGFTIVCNTKNMQNTVAGTYYLNLTLEEAVAVAFRCHSVYSIRSGFCDPLYNLGNKLHVYYSSHETFYIYSLNKMFQRNDIYEEIVI